MDRNDHTNALSRFRRSFWRPPRAHGEAIDDRRVGFIELFYDLVYVVVIARATHHLAGHLTWRGVGEFTVIFGMIWIAWMNGTFYHDLHGGEDGRSRTFIFLQMLVLALLAVYTEAAAGEAGVGFALVYALFLIVVSWLWYTVRRVDSADYDQVTGRYLTGMVISIIAVAGSAFLPDDARLVVWGLFVLMWAVGMQALDRTMNDGEGIGLDLTESVVERFGLFVIIVLGEVIVGVVTGLSETERTIGAVATGLIGLVIGFGIWWTYFDFAGQKAPSTTGGDGTRWVFSHLPLTLSIAASGAAIVSLVEHSSDAAAPPATAWLLGGSIAVALLAIASILGSLVDYQPEHSLYAAVQRVLVAGAGGMMVIAWWAPRPWLLATASVAVLSSVWVYAVSRKISASRTL